MNEAAPDWSEGAALGAKRAVARGSGLGPGTRGETLAILVPTYNCAGYLERTLASLRDQGEALAEVVVEVVDDCSTADDPAAVVAAYGDPRVTFYRHPENVGPIRNFNACLERAAATGRRWLHILHGDDAVLPGAYAAFAELHERHPEAAVMFGRCVLGDEQDVWTSLMGPLGSGRRGRLSFNAAEWGVCPVQFAGALITTDAIDAVGSFDESFCHVSDWDLWRRLARAVPVAYTNRCVGFYRVFEGNHSSTLRRQATNVREYLAQLTRLEADLPSGDVSALRQLYQPHYHRAKDQCAEFAGDDEAFTANLAALRSFPASVVRRRHLWSLRWAHRRARGAGGGLSSGEGA